MKKFSIPWDAFILCLCLACQSNLIVYAWRKQFALEVKKLDTFLQVAWRKTRKLLIPNFYLRRKQFALAWREEGLTF